MVRRHFSLRALRVGVFNGTFKQSSQESPVINRLFPWHGLALLAIFSLCTLGARAADSPEVVTLKAQGANVYTIQPVPPGGGIGVSFQDFKLDDKGWRALASLTNLKTVSIGNAKLLGNEELARLCEIKSIETLFVNGFGGTDEGLAALAKLPNLQHFGADHSPFTGQSLVALKNSPNFASLRFGGCPFDDDGLKALGELTQLKEANISHLRFTSAGFPNLGRLASLEKLVISPAFEPYYVGSDFACLSGLKNLKTIIVSEMALPYEDGLDHLKALNLQRLELHDCRVSDDDLAKVKSDHPNATIVRDYSFDEKYKRWDQMMEKRKKTASK